MDRIGFAIARSDVHGSTKSKRVQTMSEPSNWAKHLLKMVTHGRGSTRWNEDLQRAVPYEELVTDYIVGLEQLTEAVRRVWCANQELLRVLAIPGEKYGHLVDLQQKEVEKVWAALRACNAMQSMFRPGDQ